MNIECEYLQTCPFFNDKMASVPTAAAIMKIKYCKGNQDACARCMIKKAGLQVPDDLFPHQVDRARQLLK
ncbi:MAG: hypothetical protein JXB07_10405 [Anaerolineae bacterium]|nr:hypothetical protein [Anaerolineae bacterium]